MADIRSCLQKILDAIYGEEVRGSIHDALSAMNVESSSAMEQAATAKDSAKASAEVAKTAEAVATRKAEEASVSAGEAKTSEVNAEASETNSIEKSNQATAAASGAKESELAAAESEAMAIQKADEAAKSQSAAALSEAEAKAAEERTKTVRSEVETLTSQTTADKTAAEAAKIAAELARDNAAESQNDAKNSANTALTAKAAAELAKDDAEKANVTAQEAKTSTLVAKRDAENARDDAQASKVSAAESATTARQYSGKPPEPRDGTWWIWNADKQEYIDSKISCELIGPTGNGVQDIKLTQGDHTPGTTDIYTVTMTDGTSYSISVYNGRNGTGTGDVMGIWFDLVLPASGWKNGELTVSDSRLLALSTHKYFLSADEASRDEFLDCNVRPLDITTTGFITFKSDTDPSADLTVNLIRFELTANGT